MDGLFGFAANLIATATVYPIDAVKTNYQVARIQSPITIPQTIKNIIQKNGWRGLYRGLGPQLATYPIFWSVFFQTKSMDIDLVENEQINKMLVTFGAANLASTVANPFFVIKTRMQTGTHNSYTEMVKTLLNKEGPKGLFKGLPSTMVNNAKLAPQFVMYDLLQEHYNNIVFSSVTSKLVTSSIFYPLDLIRINQRNDTGILTMTEAAKKIYRTSGAFGFYRGCLLYNLQSTPNFLIMMVALEKIKLIYNKL